MVLPFSERSRFDNTGENVAVGCSVEGSVNTECLFEDSEVT